MKEFRIKISVRNNRLLRLKESSGLTTEKFCEKVGIEMSSFYSLGNFSHSPMLKNGNWNKTAQKLSDFAGVAPEDLFPEAVRKMQKFTREVEVTAAQMMTMGNIPKLLEDEITNVELEQKVDLALATLTPRETEVIKRRFGIGNDEPEDLESIAQDFGVQRERIRQIEAKALRKMRHPSRSKALRQFRYGPVVMTNEEELKYWIKKFVELKDKLKDQKEREGRVGYWDTDVLRDFRKNIYTVEKRMLKSEAHPGLRRSMRDDFRALRKKFQFDTDLRELEE